MTVSRQTATEPSTSEDVGHFVILDAARRCEGATTPCLQDIACVRGAPGHPSPSGSLNGCSTSPEVRARHPLLGACNDTAQPPHCPSGVGRRIPSAHRVHPFAHGRV